MNFTFIRAERSQEENQERAFIAAARRQDRDFKQRLESLNKASMLHFERTGKKFQLTQSQVEHKGPLMELGDGDARRRESRRFTPYTLERPLRRVQGEEGNLTSEITTPHFSLQMIQGIGGQSEHSNIHGQISQTKSTGLNVLEVADNPTLGPQTEIRETEMIKLHASLAPGCGEAANLDEEDLPPSFYDEMEDWNDYCNEFVDKEMQDFLNVHFPRSRQESPLGNVVTPRTANKGQEIWNGDVQYEHVEDITGSEDIEEYIETPEELRGIGDDKLDHE